MIDGDVNAGAWSCGLVASLIHDIPTCDELVSRIVKEAEDIIRGRLLGFYNELLPTLYKISTSFNCADFCITHTIINT